VPFCGQGKATRRWVKVDLTSKTKPLKKQRSKPQVSEVFGSVSIDLCANYINPQCPLISSAAKVLQNECQLLSNTLPERFLSPIDQNGVVFLIAPAPGERFVLLFTGMYFFPLLESVLLFLPLLVLLVF
jgi:hypothetical protein